MSSRCGYIMRRRNLLSVYEMATRTFSSTCQMNSQTYRVAIVGGGTGGITMANKLTSKFGKGNVVLIEPSEKHYYKPMWTLVGAGVKNLEDTCKPSANFIPKDCVWIKDKVASFDPQNSSFVIGSGETINYDYLIVALGMQRNWHLVDGLPEALEKDPMVVSNYSSETVTKTFSAIQNLNSGTAIFTYPRTPISCGGAPQKIMYLTEHYLRKNGKRDQVKILYNSSLPFVFGVEKYAKLFDNIIKDRHIQATYNHDLVAIRHESKEADFMEMIKCKPTGKVNTFHYDFIHVTPPMSAPDVLLNSNLVDRNGYLNVDKETLQHIDYPNVFGIGDCLNILSSKTAAAIACQSRTLTETIKSVMDGKKPDPLYDGYTCCVLVTAYNKAVMAEYSGLTMLPLETIEREEPKESRFVYFLKQHVIPVVYWNLLLRGVYEGIPHGKGNHVLPKRKCIQ